MLFVGNSTDEWSNLPSAFDQALRMGGPGSRMANTADLWGENHRDLGGEFYRDIPWEDVATISENWVVHPQIGEDDEPTDGIFVHPFSDKPKLDLHEIDMA